MSNILKKLREMFDDPLFIRQPHGLKPTLKALELWPKIKDFLSSSVAIFDEVPFDPKTDNTKFTIALSGHGMHLILPRIAKYLAKYAPNMSVSALSLSEFAGMESLLAAKVDLAIAPGFLITSNAIESEILFEEKIACIMRKKHPLAAYPLTKKDYREQKHVDIKFTSHSSEQVLDHILKDEGIVRDIQFSVPNLFTALQILNQCNAIATMPLHLSSTFREPYKMAIQPFPFEVNKFAVKVYHHKRLSSHKPLHWLISIIQNML